MATTTALILHMNVFFFMHNTSKTGAIRWIRSRKNLLLTAPLHPAIWLDQWPLAYSTTARTTSPGWPLLFTGGTALVQARRSSGGAVWDGGLSMRQQVSRVVGVDGGAKLNNT